MLSSGTLSQASVHDCWHQFLVRHRLLLLHLFFLAHFHDTHVLPFLVIHGEGLFVHGVQLERWRWRSPLLPESAEMVVE